MKYEKRVYKIHVGHLEDKDAKEYVDNVVLKFKNKTVMEPGFVYMPGLIYSEDYIPKQKILKVKEWLRLQKYFKKTINKSFYTTVDIGKIPEIDLKMESRKIETKEWKVVAGVAVGKLGQELKLTEEEAAFNKISEEFKKRGI